MSVNHVILVGRVGHDPEIRYAASGDCVATFNLATSESYKGKDGKRNETTTWHRVVIWRKLAEIVREYVKKGALLYIEGKIQIREYEGRDGNKRKAFEIVASQMKMLGGGKSEGGGSGSGGSGGGTTDEEDDFVHED